MQIILLEKISNLGNIGDIITVKPGYARNFLIPQKKALTANKKNIESFKNQYKELQLKSEIILNNAKKRAEKINKLKSITLSSRVGLEGKLFGSIGAIDIVKSLASMNIEIKKHEVRFLNGTLRHIGEHKVILHLHTDVNIELTVNIVAI